jgi:succinate dehydrogenase/fumarate reductase flavoprotein subunit
MEISWFGLLLLLVAWAATGIATAFGFYLYSKNKDYTMEKNDKNYLLTSSVNSAVALAFTTVVVLMVVFLGGETNRKHSIRINDLTNRNLELESKINDMQSQSMSSRRSNILEDPIPVRKGRGARPLIR